MGNAQPQYAYCMEKNVVYKIGEEWSVPGECSLRTCREGGVIAHKTCPEVVIPEGCFRMEGDSTEKFPTCCPIIQCPYGRPEVNPDLNNTIQNLLGTMSSSSSSESSEEDDDLEDLYEEPEDDIGLIRDTEYTLNNTNDFKKDNDVNKVLDKRLEISDKSVQKMGVTETERKVTEVRKEMENTHQHSEQIKDIDTIKDIATNVQYIDDTEKRLELRKETDIEDSRSVLRNNEFTKQTTSDIIDIDNVKIVENSETLPENTVKKEEVSTNLQNIDDSIDDFHDKEVVHIISERPTAAKINLTKLDDIVDSENEMGDHDENYVKLVNEIEASQEILCSLEDTKGEFPCGDDKGFRDDDIYVNLNKVNENVKFTKPLAHNNVNSHGNVKEVIYKNEGTRGFVYNVEDTEGFLKMPEEKDTKVHMTVESNSDIYTLDSVGKLTSESNDIGVTVQNIDTKEGNGADFEGAIMNIEDTMEKFIKNGENTEDNDYSHAKEFETLVGITESSKNTYGIIQHYEDITGLAENHEKTIDTEEDTYESLQNHETVIDIVDNQTNSEGLSHKTEDFTDKVYNPDYTEAVGHGSQETDNYISRTTEDSQMLQYSGGNAEQVINSNGETECCSSSDYGEETLSTTADMDKLIHNTEESQDVSWSPGDLPRMELHTEETENYSHEVEETGVESIAYYGEYDNTGENAEETPNLDQGKETFESIHEDTDEYITTSQETDGQSTSEDADSFSQNEQIQC